MKIKLQAYLFGIELFIASDPEIFGAFLRIAGNMGSDPHPLSSVPNLFGGKPLKAIVCSGLRLARLLILRLS